MSQVNSQLPLVDYDEAARLLCISPRTLRRRVDAGEIRRVRIGGAVRFSLRELESFVAAQESVCRA
jgi:excisionase family DNA binding protein